MTNAVVTKEKRTKRCTGTNFLVSKSGSNQSSQHAEKIVHLRVKLQDQVEPGVPGSKLEIHNAINAQLLDVFQPPRPQMLAQLQREVAWSVTFLLLVLQTKGSMI